MSPRVVVRIALNGREREVGEGALLSDLLGSLSLPSEGCAVEVNGRLVRREEGWDLPLADGDRIEVVTLVGGG